MERIEDELRGRIAALEADLEHRERQLDAIRRTSEALFSYASVDALIEATLHTALDVLRAEAGTVFLYDAAQDALVFRYVIGPAEDQLIGKAIPLSDGGVAWTVFLTGQSNLVGDVATRQDFNAEVDQQSGFHTHSMMTVPVKRTGAAPIGVMQALNARVPFTPHDLEVLEVLCNYAASAIAQADMLASLRKAEIGNRVGEIVHDIKNLMTPLESGLMTLEPLLTDFIVDLRHLAASCPPDQAWGGRIERSSAAVREIYPWLIGDLIAASKRVRRRTEYIAGMVKGTLPPPVFEEGSINDVVNDVVKTLARGARERGVHLSADLDPHVPRLDFDYDRLYDALYNLVNNAVPETPRGGSVTVRTRAPRPDESDVVLSVEDTGRGIPPSVLEKLFTPGAISTKVGGTGLGTSVVARVVREHGGQISVSSQIGQGATFTIRLPRERPAPP